MDVERDMEMQLTTNEAEPELRLRLVGANSEYWRRLAQEARSEAEQITNSRAKQMMLNVAETYDGMARRAEKKEKAAR